MEYGGFLARRDENPILDEEERFAASNRVRVYPQWDGDVVGRWNVGPGWALRLSSKEKVYWLNEGPPPKPADRESGSVLHQDAKGFLLCAACGNLLSAPAPNQGDGGRRLPRRQSASPDQFGHREGCTKVGTPPQPQALVASGEAQVLRLLVPVPDSLDEFAAKSWGYSLGYSALIGMQRLYMLDPAELDFELEGPWKLGAHKQISLAFIDPSLGGTGYLRRIADEFNLVAEMAIGHLDHAGCETACYRCLKSYQNQRHHEFLRWPTAIPHLQSLAAEPTVVRRLETGDVQDPGPWLEAYSEGLGSPLELAFARLFAKHGFNPKRQVPISTVPGRPAISVADFAVPESRLAIYIDGAAFHTGANLRRDRYIRNLLRGATEPWRVEELTARDLAGGQSLVRRLVFGESD